MTEIHTFKPDWMSPPGETIRNLMNERDLSLVWLAQALKKPEEDVVDLLAGREIITKPLAKALAETLGASIHFWLRRDALYQAALNESRLLEDDWLAQVPVRDMIKYGWIDAAAPKQDRTALILDFFNLNDAADWKTTYEPLRQNYAFRTSLSFESNPIGVSVWLRQGERMAAHLQCAPWNATAFEQALPSVRKLTREKNPQVFIPKLQRICAQHGVAVVVVPLVQGCRVSGAARFETKDKAVIMLSARYLSDDHFWFTFFHEAAHLILHRKDILNLDINTSPQDAENPQAEEEANNFSSQMLIPENRARDLKNLSKSHKDIIRFAANVGISPGIIVGQLQYQGLLERNWLNKLKRRYKWDRDQLRHA